MLLCAHLDTVAVAGEIEPVVVDGGWENAHDAILGADNKAAVAVFLEVARRASVEGAPVGIELLLTVEEEDALAGAKAFDASVLRADFGYVFDHATPIGEVIVASPTYYRIARRVPRAAPRTPGSGRRPGAARCSPPRTRSQAMPHGRIDDETTANVGSIEGGVGSTNVVPERCRLLAEARSLDAERVEEVVAEMIDAIQDGAAAGECDVDVTCEKLFTGYRQKGTAPPSWPRRPRCARAATSRSASPPAAARTRTRSRCRGSSASTSPTAPSATTSRPSA